MRQLDSVEYDLMRHGKTGDGSISVIPFQVLQLLFFLFISSNIVLELILIFIICIIKFIPGYKLEAACFLFS